jgi:glycosyltransferase involved in cell wall biosynthesis
VGSKADSHKPLRVLVVHNRYQSRFPSGENVVVDREISALRKSGVIVETFFRSSDELASMNLKQRLIFASSPLTGRASRDSFFEVVENFQPEIVHLHNPYPLISPAVIEWCARKGVPVVATIHNYRLRCMNGLLYRDGAICTKCEDNERPWSGVLRGCYRASKSQSALMAASIYLHRRQWVTVSRFIAVSNFVGNRLQQWGFDSSKVVVKHNPIEDPGIPPLLGDGFLFAGRLSKEKGLPLLIDAWARSRLGSTTKLVIAGDGPLREFVERRAQEVPGIEFVGPVSANELQHLHYEAAVGVVPSTCFDALPSVPEFFASGRPVIGTDVGGISEMIDESVGWLSQLTIEDLSAKFLRASDRSTVQIRATNARRRYEQSFKTSVVVQKLLDIYRSVL